MRGVLTPNGLLPIRGGRGAPGTPPAAGRAGRAGASPAGGIAGAVGVAGTSVDSTGREGAGRGVAAVKAGLGELTVGWAEAAGWVGAAGCSAAAATWGWTVGAVGAFGAAAADTGATAAATTGGLPAPGAGRMGLGPPGRADGVRGRSAVAADPPLPTGLFAGLPPFPSPPLAAAAGAGVPTGNASFSLRTTGASIVDEALLTNSPNSLSLAMISLLDLPSSFASSCTRALPATALLTVRPGGRTARPRVSCTGSLLELHGVLTTGRPAFGGVLGGNRSTRPRSERTAS